MSESDRRYDRYSLDEAAFKTVKLKRHGVMGLLSGYVDCKVKDMSKAGALVLCSSSVSLGSRISLKLELQNDSELVFLAEVVNLGRDVTKGLVKLGLRLEPSPEGSAEYRFLDSLAENYQKSF